jgi:hypothetical protein
MSTNICYSAHASSGSGESLVSLNGVADGVYSVYVCGQFMNLENHTVPLRVGVTINVNNDNMGYDAIVGRNWDPSTLMLPSRSVFVWQGAVDLDLKGFATGAQNSVSAKAHLHEGSALFASKIVLIVMRKYK